MLYIFDDGYSPVMYWVTVNIGMKSQTFQFPQARWSHCSRVWRDDNNDVHVCDESAADMKCMRNDVLFVNTLVCEGMLHWREVFISPFQTQKFKSILKKTTCYP